MFIKHGTTSGFKFTRTKLIILIFHNHDGTAPFLPVILVSLVVLALLAAFVSLVAVVLFLLLFALYLLSFCLRYYSTHLVLIILLPTPCFILFRIIHNKKYHWCMIHIQWTRLYLLSRLCHGLLLCLSKVIFVMQPMISMHHWKPSTTSFSTLPPCTRVPSI